MPHAELMDLTKVSRGFPLLAHPQIVRDNVLDAIESIFEGHVQIIIVEGREGIGKTTLAAQFATRHLHDAVSLFITPSSRWAYDPDIVRFDLCNQLAWMLNGTELSAIEDANDGFLRRAWLQLQRRARKSPVFFVVDGLNDIPNEDSEIKRIIVDMLPIGLSNFHFIFTAGADQKLVKLPVKSIHKPFPVTPFALDETLRYLADLELERSAVEDLNKLCKGFPGFLAAARRILLSGTSIANLLNELPEQLPDLFDIEWRNANLESLVELPRFDGQGATR